MNRIGSITTVAAVSLLLLSPAAAVAAVQSCAGLAPTFPSNYSEQASALLLDVRNDGKQIAEQIADLKRLEKDPDLSWGIHALQFERIQSEIEEMNAKLCRLETIQRVAEGWQRKVIFYVIPRLRAMSINAHLALDHVVHHEGELWTPSYRKCTENLHDEAAAVADAIDHDEHLVLVRMRESNLEANRWAGR
jgi:hypothetical protein